MKDTGKENIGVTVVSGTSEDGLERRDLETNMTNSKNKNILNDSFFWGEVYAKHERLRGNILLLKAILESLHCVK